MSSRTGRSAETSRSRGRLALVVLVGAVLLASTSAPAGDRLQRFRELAATRLGPIQILDGEPSPAIEHELLTLLDEEIVENLEAGGIFASAAFLQDRLDAFGDAWGGAALRVVRVGPLVVGAFQLHDAARPGAVRVYRDPREGPVLVATFSRPGRPTVYGLPPAGGVARFLVAWEGAPVSPGTRALRLDLVRQRGDGAGVAWSTAELFPEGLPARSYRLAGGELRIRYELRYPGWAPGCEGQTEVEDVYRLAAGGAAFVRAGRQQHNGWHRDLRAAAARLFEALAAGDAARLAALVPDRELRSRLPVSLRPEPACDAPEGPGPERVSVAAADARAPWQLTFQRSASQWRLTAASPVIP